MFFKAEIPADAVKVLIAVAPSDPLGAVAADAAFKIAGSLNAFRGDDGPFGIGAGVEESEIPDTMDELCRKIEAYLPDDEKDGVPGYGANSLFEALIAALVRKIIEQVLPKF